MTDNTQPPTDYPPQGSPAGYPPQGPPPGYAPQGAYPAQPQPPVQESSGSGGKKTCLIVAIIFVVIALLAGGAALYLGVLVGGGVRTIFSAVEAGSNLYEAEEAAMAYYDKNGRFTDDPEALERMANTAGAGRQRQRPGGLGSLEFVKGTPTEDGVVGVMLCDVVVPPDLKAPTPSPTSTSKTSVSPTASPTSQPPSASDSSPSPTATSTATPVSTVDQVLMFQVKYDGDKAFASLMVEGDVMYRAFELVGCPSSLPPAGPWRLWSHTPFADIDEIPTPTPTRSRRR